MSIKSIVQYELKFKYANVRNTNSVDLLNIFLNHQVNINKRTVKLLFVLSMLDNTFWRGNSESKKNKLLYFLNNSRAEECILNRINFLLEQPEVKKSICGDSNCIICKENNVKSDVFSFSNYRSYQYMVYLAAKIDDNTEEFLTGKSLKNLIFYSNYDVHHIIPKGILKGLMNNNNYYPLKDPYFPMVSDCTPLNKYTNEVLLNNKKDDSGKAVENDPSVYLSLGWGIENINENLTKQEWRDNLIQNDIPEKVVNDPTWLKRNRYSEFMNDRRLLMLKSVKKYVDNIK